MKDKTSAASRRGNGMSDRPAQSASGSDGDGGDTLGPALAACLERLSRGDLSARDTIIEIVAGRLRTLAHRMLARFPNVRRWDDTDDVFQNAALRLHRSLGQMHLVDPRSVMAVAATELHRELLDLARRHAGPLAYARNHGTNVVAAGADVEAGERWVDRAAATDDDSLDRWSEFHEAIAALEPQHREVFQMVWYLGCDQHTVAATLGCSTRTVKTRWREAREAVHKRLAGDPPS
jgi:RNA polymerase sigma factor (sigma-70 family)